MKDVCFDLGGDLPDALRDVPEIFGVAAGKSHGEEEGFGRQKQGGTSCEIGNGPKVYKGQLEETRRPTIFGSLGALHA